MDSILERIEQEFALRILEAQENFDRAQFDLANLHATKQLKMDAVRDYQDAIAQKEQAEIVIAGTDDSIKSLT